MQNVISKFKNKTDEQKEDNNDLVFSYMTLRNIIGFGGMLLPLALYLFASKDGNDKAIESSISEYFYTNVGDILVVTLSTLAVFLFTYKGYNWKERALTIIAAICGIGVAFSPTASKYKHTAYSVHTYNDKVAEFLGKEQHIIFAGIFFLSISLICLIYFPKSKGVITKNKIKRNIVYKICGWIMLLCIGLLIVSFTPNGFNNFIGDFPITFTLETIAIEAFGISWITKGETLWPDGEHYAVTGFKNIKRNVKSGLK